MNVGKETKCPICKKKFIEHSELQDKICKMITIKQFANISPGFDVQHRPFFEDWISIVSQSVMGSNLIPSIDSSGQRITTKNIYKKTKYKI